MIIRSFHHIFKDFFLVFLTHWFSSILTKQVRAGTYKLCPALN